MISVNLKHTQANSSNYRPLLQEAKKKFLTQDLGFKKLPYNYGDLLPQFKIADELIKDKKAIVVIGIGGSDLGTRAIVSALLHPHYNEYADITLNNEPKIYFIGDSPDPENLTSLFDILNLERTLFLVVSKSGNTIEQASTFVYVREQYLQAKLDPKQFIAFITDKTNGSLREIAQEGGYKTMEFPGDVGGRFSVLSTVGSIPSHLLGIDVSAMLQGAQDLQELIKSSKDGERDDVLEYTLHKFANYKEGKTISVMMLYQYCLEDLGKWYQQLWGESLGKKVNDNGEEVNEGQTPISVVGPVFQHSQLQLYNEGANDKFYTFIRAEESRNDTVLKGDFKGINQFDFMQGKSMQSILNYEQETTAFSLSKYGRPHATISIPKVDAYHLGQLFYFFEVSVTLFGYALGINPFDQPGVELSKNAMYGVLGKQGYEDVKQEFEEWKNN